MRQDAAKEHPEAPKMRSKGTRKLQKDILNGPGVADMKGGLLVMLSALEAFEKTDLAHKLNWIVMINPDEEIGSISSKVHLENHAKKIIKAL